MILNIRRQALPRHIWLVFRGPYHIYHQPDDELDRFPWSPAQLPSDTSTLSQATETDVCQKAPKERYLSDTVHVPDASASLLFQYRPLTLAKEIRLVKIQSGAASDPLEIRIIHALFYVQIYDAVSYTWGDETDRVLVTIRPTAAKISVTRNCEEALLALRYNGVPRTVWVDAIGINQNDTGERNEQVRMMADIYGGARQVIIYLGKTSGDSDLAMYRISNFSPYERRHETISLGAVQRIKRLLQRPWFNRMSIKHLIWVIQEAALAQDAVVRCGDISIPWHHFLYIPANFIKTVPPTISIRYRSTLRRAAGTEAYLFDLLCQTRQCQAKEPRDKLFGILSLLRPTPPLSADYRKSTAEVFTEVAVVMMNRIGPRSLGQVFDANAPLARRSACLFDWKFTLIIEDCPTFSPLVARKPVSISTAIQFASRTIAAISSPLVSTYVPWAWNPILVGPDVAGLQTIRKTLGLPLERGLRDIDSVELTDDVSRLWYGRRLFTTPDGLAGLAPTNAREGDWSCTFDGCHVPYLLRYHENKYSYVGEAFVDRPLDYDYLGDQSRCDFDIV
ncbi:HET-domain-containing protein [Lophium mytilinum]|uniref:HET-domain-containing protein n=1 Tax=Lophium mytilinum TaxID=390894 RepID=A0A6A6R040_9PEZI|nr:HET-domain-containing protein [Lophium mytilinum]